MRSVQEGVCGLGRRQEETLSAQHSENEHGEARMNKDTKLEIGQLLRGSTGVRWTEEQEFKQQRELREDIKM